MRGSGPHIYPIMPCSKWGYLFMLVLVPFSLYIPLNGWIFLYLAARVPFMSINGNLYIWQSWSILCPYMVIPDVLARRFLRRLIQ